MGNPAQAYEELLVYDNSPVIKLTAIPTKTTSMQAIMLYQTYEIR